MIPSIDWSTHATIWWRIALLLLIPPPLPPPLGIEWWVAILINNQKLSHNCLAETFGSAPWCGSLSSWLRRQPVILFGRGNGREWTDPLYLALLLLRLRRQRRWVRPQPTFWRFKTQTPLPHHHHHPRADRTWQQQLKKLVVVSNCYPGVESIINVVDNVSPLYHRHCNHRTPSPQQQRPIVLPNKSYGSFRHSNETKFRETKWYIHL